MGINAVLGRDVAMCSVEGLVEVVRVVEREYRFGNARSVGVWIAVVGNE